MQVDMNTFIKKYIFVAILSLFALPSFGLAQTFCYPLDGCTGTSTTPILNSILIGNSDGVYDVKTITAGTNITLSNSGSTFTISATGGGSVFPFSTATNYGTTTSATTTPLWLQGSQYSLFASSTAVFEDTITANATTTTLFSTTASSTNLFSQTARFGTLTVPILTSAITLTGANGLFAEYTGTS